MKYKGSIKAESKRSRNLQVIRRGRNKAGQFLGRLRVVMRNKRQNGKAGRYATTQG